MAEIWVANASPLITLAKAGQLGLLQGEDRQLIVPEAVRIEVMLGPADNSARKILESGFDATFEHTTSDPMVLEWGLGAGETTVLSIAKERDGVGVVDDRAARMAAKVMGIRVIGTLGVVLRAQRMGQIQSAVEAIRSLRNAGLHLDDGLIREALAKATGESWRE